MKKGSIVYLRTGFFSGVEERLSLESMGFPPLEHNVPYLMSRDALEYTCPGCGLTHPGIELEEYPGLLFNGQHFEEVLTPQEVELEALLG